MPVRSAQRPLSDFALFATLGRRLPRPARFMDLLIWPVNINVLGNGRVGVFKQFGNGSDVLPSLCRMVA